MDEIKTNTFKSNVIKDDTAPPERKKLEKVVTNKTMIKKKSEFSKLKDIFIAEDATNVKSYIVMDVLIPAIKKAVSDIITNGIDMILYGETGRSKRNSTSSKVSYRSYYDGQSERKRATVDEPRSNSNYRDVIVGTRAEAMEIISQMDDLISAYGFACVADLYELADIPTNYTHNNYGWRDISTACPVTISEGILLKFPRPIPMNR